MRAGCGLGTRGTEGHALEAGSLRDGGARGGPKAAHGQAPTRPCRRPPPPTCSARPPRPLLSPGRLSRVSRAHMSLVYRRRPSQGQFLAAALAEPRTTVGTRGRPKRAGGDDRRRQARTSAAHGDRRRTCGTQCRHGRAGARSVTAWPRRGCCVFANTWHTPPTTEPGCPSL